MTWQKGGEASELVDPSSGAKVRMFQSEQEMLSAWLVLLKDWDPDAIVTFQARSCSPFGRSQEPFCASEISHECVSSSSTRLEHLTESLRLALKAYKSISDKTVLTEI